MVWQSGYRGVAREVVAGRMREADLASTSRFMGGRQKLHQLSPAPLLIACTRSLDHFVLCFPSLLTSHTHTSVATLPPLLYLCTG